jgi:hypothetical protein
VCGDVKISEVGESNVTKKQLAKHPSSLFVSATSAFVEKVCSLRVKVMSQRVKPFIVPTKNRAKPGWYSLSNLVSSSAHSRK